MRKKLDTLGIVIFATILAFSVGLQAAQPFSGTTKTMGDDFIEVQDLNVTGNWYRGLDNRTDTLAYPEQGASYIIFKDGSTTLTKNGETGQIEYSSTTSDFDVANYTLFSLPSTGGHIHLKRGDYTFTAQLKREIDNVLFTGDGKASNITYVVQSSHHGHLPAIDALRNSNWVFRELAFCEGGIGLYAGENIIVENCWWGPYPCDNKLGYLKAYVPNSKTYYVDGINGNDSDYGGVNTPFVTMQHANDIMEEGDTCIVRTGVYTGDTITFLIPSKNHLTFKAAPGEEVIIDGSRVVTGWSLTAGKTNTYEKVLPEHSHFSNVWEDGSYIPLAVQENITAVEANPGSSYENKTTYTMYVHTRESDNPNNHVMRYCYTEVLLRVGRFIAEEGPEKNVFGIVYEGFTTRYSTNAYYQVGRTHHSVFRNSICYASTDQTFLWFEFPHNNLVENIYAKDNWMNHAASSSQGTKIEHPTAYPTIKPGPHHNTVKNVYFENIEGGGVFVFAREGSFHTFRNVVVNNCSTAAFAVFWSSDDTLFDRCIAIDGAANGFDITDTSLRNLIDKSIAISCDGIGIYYATASSGEAKDCIALSCGTYGMYGADPAVTFSYCDSYDNPTANYGGGFTNPLPATLLTADPLFESNVSSDANFLELGSGSPCIGTGEDGEDMGTGKGPNYAVNSQTELNIELKTDSGNTTIANNEYISHDLSGIPDIIVTTPRIVLYDSVTFIVGVIDRNSTHFQVGCYWTNGTAISDDAIQVDWYAEYDP